MAGRRLLAAHARGSKRHHKRGAETRARILEVAERLFAERGIDGVSLRDVTREAEVELALVNYHFKTKDGLFETMLAQRFDQLFEWRRERLAALPPRPKLGEVVDAFLDPIRERLVSDEIGWRHFSAIAAHISSFPRYSRFRQEHLDPTAVMIVAALGRIYPAADRRLLYWAYIMLSGGLSQVLSGSDRLYLLSRGLCDLRDLETAFIQLRAFSIGGIRATMALGVAGLPTALHATI